MLFTGKKHEDLSGTTVKSVYLNVERVVIGRRESSFLVPTLTLIRLKGAKESNR